MVKFSEVRKNLWGVEVCLLLAWGWWC